MLDKIWCKLMELLDKRFWCTAAYEIAAVHCLFTRLLGWRIRETYTDLIVLPFYLVRCGGYEDKHWCTRPCRTLRDE